MKLHTKNILSILILFLSFTNFYAQNNINKLFFDLPLESSRDTIYTSIKKYGFIKYPSQSNVTRNDTIIKTFYGYLDKNKYKDIVADSVNIQLSFGHTSIYNKKYYQNLLIISAYHYFPNAISAKNFYKTIKKEMGNIVAKEPTHYKHFEDNLSSYKDYFYYGKDEKTASVEYKKEKKKYVVTLTYQRKEGNKRLINEVIKKKELLFRDIDPKNLFYATNVEKVPIIKKCPSEKTDLIKCFQDNIVTHISKTIDFDGFNLAPGIYHINIRFIVDKSKNIINIDVKHKNSKLREAIINSINEIKITEPAMNKGMEVDFLVTLPISVGIN